MSGWDVILPDSAKRPVKALFSLADKDGESRKILERVASKGEAQRRAKASLRKSNKSEIEGTITMVGTIDIVSGMTVDVWGAGAFDGKYFVERVARSVSVSGYTATLQVRRTLEGY